MGLGGVAIAALPSVVHLQLAFSDRLGGYEWNAIWQEPEMTEAWKRVEARKEQEAKEKATLIQRQYNVKSHATFEKTRKCA